METVHTDTSRGAAMNSLAIVGFVALIIIGILATIYAASFIPKMFGSGSRNTGAAYLSTVQDEGTTQAPTQAVTAQPAQTGTSAGTLTPATPEAPKTVTNTVTNTIYRYVPVTTSNPSTSYYGQSDLTVSVIDKGYYSGGSFVSSSYVPNGSQGAVRYRVTNNGTNESGSFRVDIRVESPSGVDTDSTAGGALAPGKSVVGTGRFDSSNGGTANVRLTVVSTGSVSESNTGNNSDSTSISLGGNGGTYTNTYTTRNSDNYDSNGNYCSYGTYYSDSRYYCNTSTATRAGGNYNSDGSYCTYGTYQQYGRYYCNPSYVNNYNNNDYNRNYDSNGNYCSYGVYESAGRLYCNSSNSGTNIYYTNRDSSCTYGTYIRNGTYYCY